MVYTFSKLVLKHCLFAILFVSFLTGCSAPGPHQIVTSDRLVSDVQELCSPEFEGRETGTKGERAAGEWLAGRMHELGLIPAGDSLWFQHFTYTPHPPMQMHAMPDSSHQLGMALVQEIHGRNVLGALPGKTEQIGVLAAHYDHLGLGDENSLFKGEPTIHYGADDNASGVALILGIAEKWMAEGAHQNELLLAGFSGEEKGLWGSNHFCKEPTIDLHHVKYMINLDMVGRLRGDTLAVYGTGTSPGWMDLLNDCNEDGLVLVPSESGVGPSDHTSFYLVDIPVLHFFTGQHPDYHRPTDTADKLNYEGMLKVGSFIGRIMRRLDAEAEWPFTKTVDSDPSDTPDFKVTLGVVPDYLFSGSGMRIDGVSEDRPAHHAGMKRGDIVTHLGDIEVTDMMSYMQALGAFAPGDQCTAILIRKNEEIQTVVTWD